MEKHSIQFTNSKNGNTVTTNLSRREALIIVQSIKNPSAFVTSILSASNSKFGLTGNQNYWFWKLAEDNRPDKVKENNSVQVGQGMAKIAEMFDRAKVNGIKKPKIRLQNSIGERVTLSLAPETGNNKGFIYVKLGKENPIYCGKISPAGSFSKSGDCKEEMVDYLKSFSNDPISEIKNYGRLLGQCSFCGRTLTREESIARMCGLICFNKYLG